MCICIVHFLWYTCNGLQLRERVTNFPLVNLIKSTTFVVAGSGVCCRQLSDTSVLLTAALACSVSTAAEDQRLNIDRS